MPGLWLHPSTPVARPTSQDIAVVPNQHTGEQSKNAGRLQTEWLWKQPKKLVLQKLCLELKVQKVLSLPACSCSVKFLLTGVKSWYCYTHENVWCPFFEEEERSWALVRFSKNSEAHWWLKARDGGLLQPSCSGKYHFSQNGTRKYLLLQYLYLT